MTQSAAATMPAVFTAGIPEEMKQERRWVLWRREPRDGKYTKVPYRTEGEGPASSTKSSTWSTFEEVCAEKRQYNGIGFVLGDGFVGVDYDHVRDAETGAWQPGILEEICSFGSYAEISQSGTGAHVILKGNLPGKGKHRDIGEIYGSGRFFVVTGHHIEETPREVTEGVPGMVERMYDRLSNHAGDNQPPTSHTVAHSPTLSNDDVLDQCLRARNRDKFERLWNGDTSGYDSPSQADYALCLIFAFYTQNEAQIEQLMRQSALYRADKWNNHRTYLADTIRKAINSTTARYTGGGVQHGRPVMLEHEELAPDDRVDVHLDNATYTKTDAGNSERFVFQFGQNVRYNASTKEWLCWDGTRWKADDIGSILGMATAAARSIYLEAGHEENETERKALLGWGKQSEALVRRKAMLEGAQHLVGVTADQLDANPDLFNVINGTIELSTQTFRPHRRGDLLTKMAGITYSPTATCPLWEEHLRTMFCDNQITIDSFQMMCGYSLLQSNPDHVVVLLVGDGNNGKTETLRPVQLIMGDYAVHIEANTLMQTRHDDGGRARPDILKLKGARFATCSEPDANAKLSESFIKSVTGDKEMTARAVYGIKPITFPPGVKIFIATNYLPKITGTDEGIWRRIWAFGFYAIIPPEKRMPDYGDVMYRQEASGIFNWMLAGLRRYMEQGRLDRPPEVQKATQEYRKQEHPLAEFFEEWCVLGPQEQCTKGELYAAYTEWCASKCVNALKMIPFGKMLKGIAEDDRTDKQRLWKGIRPKTPMERMLFDHADDEVEA